MSVRVRTPGYRLHKPSGLAVVTLGGKDHYLGKHGSAESLAEYGRLIGEWMAGAGRARPAAAGADITVNELVLAYLHFADGYYRKNGRPTKEPGLLRLSYRPLREHYGHTLAREFGPLALKAVREAMIAAGTCRAEINRRVGRIVRAFKWATENELIPASVHHGLRTIAGLKKGRSEARESAPVRPAPEAIVEAVRPYVSRQVWAMIQLQLLTGMRPGEVCRMRTRDVDRSGRLWVYTPEDHKTEHHGKQRRVYLGPNAQEVLRPWLRADPAAFLFSPREATEERHAGRSAARRTPLTPSQQARARKARPARSPAECYDARSYAHAVAAACARAFPHPGLSGVPRADRTPAQRRELAAWRRRHHWHPNQLRHNAATRLRKEFGLDTARAVLGHSSPAVTEVYAELDQSNAAEAMERVG
jgi:integrase